MGGLAALVFGRCRYSNSGAPGYLVVGRPVGFMAAVLRRPAGGQGPAVFPESRSTSRGIPCLNVRRASV
jgi:hypothetical protein